MEKKLISFGILISVCFMLNIVTLDFNNNLNSEDYPENIAMVTRIIT